MKWKKWKFPKAEVFVFPLLLMVIWETVVRLELVPPSQSAAPSDVLSTLWHLIVSGELIKQAGFSLARLVTGVLAGGLIGIITGIILATSKIGDRFFSPTIQFLAGIPIVLWMPFCVMIFRTEEAFKISLAAVCTFFLVTLLTLQAVRLVEKKYLELATLYGRNFSEKVREIYLPYSAPSIFSALRISLVIVWIVLFFVEYAIATPGREGLGWFIADARSVGKIEEEFAGLFFLGLLAFFTDWLVAKAQKGVSSWRESLETLFFTEEK